MPKTNALPRWVYYGTTTEFQRGFQRMNLKKVRQSREFGCGFYADGQRETACQRARHSAADSLQPPLLVTFRVDTQRLQQLKGLFFPFPDASWQNFILKNLLPANAGRPEYEFVYGPAAHASVLQCITEIKNGRQSYADLQRACQEAEHAPVGYQLCCLTDQALGALILKGSLVLA
ncbi:uncharacterized protein DUF3990 [Hydrogenispora ethanolica]|jgi:hypothetical protein|uniref:Uncharacterized protein DUF3990 n=1 Tax=Hydrogenispora ethanolica TaxID=1082276 RepID=A0A4R1RIF5_HYDET|nr:DUF3990 domain-containing protein [Hydrogenispora ethanolica]TCL65883.1 uncharacterized protein DUF3990 [Hydrogenispora ethanolica]